MPTTQTFQLVAEVIAAIPAHTLEGLAYKVVVADAFADRFQKENPKFKRSLFLKACGVK